MRLRAAIGSITLIALLVAPVQAGSNDDIQKIQNEMDKRKKELQNLNSEYNRKQKELQTVEKQVVKTTNQLKRLERSLDAKEEELTRIQKQLEDAEARLDEAKRQVEETEKKLERRLALLKKRVRALYEHGSVTYLDVLLSSKDFSDFLTRVENLQIIVQSDVNLFEEVKELRLLAIKLKETRERERLVVMATRDKVEEMKEHLETEKNETERLKQKLVSDQNEIRRALDDLERESERITAELKRLQAKYEEQLKREGAIVLMAPLQARITSSFGMRFHPIARQNRMHTGVDYGASFGTPIKAAESGKVVTADWLGGYGKAVIIYHGKQVSTLYGHMSTLNVSNGEMVQKGQVIGTVGSTGFSTGPHLHFEVRINGEPRNPLEYIGQAIK